MKSFIDTGSIVFLTSGATCDNDNAHCYRTSVGGWSWSLQVCIGGKVIHKGKMVTDDYGNLIAV